MCKGVQTRNHSSPCSSRESLDIYNRLHSTQADIAFVNQVHAAYPSFPLIRTVSCTLQLIPSFHLIRFPLTANLRCGAWYTDPAIVHSRSAYDSLRALSDDVICRRIPRHMRARIVTGHHGNCQWAFKFQPSPSKHTYTIRRCHSRRVRRHHHNLIFSLKMQKCCFRLILVNSTRAGKRLPDVLSQTLLTSSTAPHACAASPKHRRRRASRQPRRQISTPILTCVRQRGQSAPTNTPKSPRGLTAGPWLSQ